jgi:hypothetical protein
MPCGADDHVADLLAENGPHGGAMGQQRGLSVVGAGQLLGGPVEAEPAERRAEDVVGLLAELS